MIGADEHRHECHHNRGQLPAHVRRFETHGVAVDKAGFSDIKHRASGDRPKSVGSGQDTIVVFDPDGKFVRSFGKEYHGGGHGTDIREENGVEFPDLSCMFPVNIALKTDRTGKVVGLKERKEFALRHRYDDEKARFSPTNRAFAADGGFYVAAGYVSKYVYNYDRDAKYLSAWGGTGKGVGQFQTPHGLWLDDRPGRSPAIVGADRANARRRDFDLDGEHARIVEGVSFPAHLATRGEVLLVPDRHARVTRMDRDNKVITHLGSVADWTKKMLDGSSCEPSPRRGSTAVSFFRTTPASTTRGIFSSRSGSPRAESARSARCRIVSTRWNGGRTREGLRSWPTRDARPFRSR